MTVAVSTSTVNAAIDDGLTAYWSFDTGVEATFGGSLFNGIPTPGVSRPPVAGRRALPRRTGTDDPGPLCRFHR